MSETAIGPATEPFSKPILEFIDAYVNCLDLEKSATFAGFQPEMGKILYKRPAIKAEIKRRTEAVNAEVHVQVATKRVVTVAALDRNLMKIVRLTKKDILGAPALASATVRAIELGYQRTGLLLDGNFIPDASTEAGKPEEAPRIFRATDQEIITHQVIETHQKTTVRSVSTESSFSPKESSPSTIEGKKDDVWDLF